MSVMKKQEGNFIFPAEVYAYIKRGGDRPFVKGTFISLANNTRREARNHAECWLPSHPDPVPSTDKLAWNYSRPTSSSFLISSFTKKPYLGSKKWL